MPKKGQVLVLWRGSDSDPTLLEGQEGIHELVSNIEEIVLSGHKKTKKCLAKLAELEKTYPDGGVIIAIVGRSNGLGPVLSAHTVWPVISMPVTYKDFPEDIHSSIRMPSDTPNATVWPEKNAVRFALKILAFQNPDLRSLLQMKIDNLDC